MTVEEGVTLGVTLSVTEESVAVTVCVVLDEGRAEEELGSVLVLEFTDITTLDKFKLVARGEAVNDDKTIAVDVAFGCKAELVKFLMMDVMFTLTDLDENITVLDGRNKELDKIMLELLNDSGNEELVFMTELLILLNVGTMVLNVGTILLTDGTIVLNVGTLLFNVGTTLLNDV